MSDQKQQLTIKLSIDASEAFEALAKVKAELEQVIALQGKVVELEGQVTVQPNVDIDKVAKELAKHLELALISHTP